MVEVTLQLSPPLSKSIKEIANKQFEGSLTAVLKAALEFYLDSHARKRKQLKKVVQQIRQQVEARGGLDEKDLERRISEYRRVKYSKPQ
jgi:hypothetical protein